MSKFHFVLIVSALFAGVLACNIPTAATPEPDASPAAAAPTEQAALPTEAAPTATTPPQPTATPAPTETPAATATPELSAADVVVPTPDADKLWQTNNEGLNTYTMEKYEFGCQVDFPFTENQQLISHSFMSLSESRNKATLGDVLTGTSTTYEDWKDGKFVGFTEEQLHLIVYNPAGFAVQFYPKGDHPADDTPCAYLIFTRVKD